MAFWNRKKKPEEKEVREETPASRDWCLYARECLKEGMEREYGVSSELDGNTLWFPQWQLRLGLSFERLEQADGGRVLSDLDCYGWQPDLAPVFYEAATVVGDSFESAIRSSTDSLLLGAMDGWVRCMTKQFSGRFMAPVQGKPRIWQLAHGGKAVMGAAENPKVDQGRSLWDVIGQETIPYLGAQRIYWVKAYVGLIRGENYSEVRVNDMRIERLSQILKDYAATLPISGNVYTEKQFFFLVQEDATYVPYPHPKELVQEKTLALLELLNRYGMKEDFDTYYSELDKLFGEDGHLADEVICFCNEIPALYAYREKLMCNYELFTYRNGERKDRYYLTQMTAFPWIQEALIDAFRQGKYSNELFRLMLSGSAIVKTVQQAEENGNPIKVLSGFGIVDDAGTFLVR